MLKINAMYLMNKESKIITILSTILDYKPEHLLFNKRW